MNTPYRMRTVLMFWLAFVVALSLAFAVDARLALAQAPANDDFDNATSIPGLPFADAVNTAEATTAADDPECFGQGPTVWYAFTFSEDIRLAANTFGSDYDTTLSVYTGTRGNLTQVDCNDDFGGGTQSQVTFDAAAGETYYFMVGAFASGLGGNLLFAVDVAPPPPPPLTIDLTIDGAGSVVPKTGRVTLHGTITCSRQAFVDLFGSLEQKVGRFLIHGFFGTFLECDGETPWSATFIGDNGRFAGGKAIASVFAFAFDPLTGEFVENSVENQGIQLRGTKPTPGVSAAATDSSYLFLPLIQD